jgi:hypothetical protein
VADVPRLGAVLRDPRPVRRLERVAERDLGDFLMIAHQVRRDLEHHRRLIFARMADPPLLEIRIDLVRLAAEGPVSRAQKQQIVASPQLLP